MGKRSNFKRRKHDFYETPYHAFEPLLPHIEFKTYAEPCVGNMALVGHLLRHGFTASYMSDIDPRYDTIPKEDALTLTLPAGTEQVITNTPWSRPLLHPIIDNLRKQAPTWILLDSGWMHTKQSAPYMPYCRKIVSVGRVKWIADSKHTGKDDAVWLYFLNHKTDTKFYGRV